MSSLAILIGNAEYHSLAKLACCRADVIAIKELIDSTEKFDGVELILDAEAFHLKDRIRAAIDVYESLEEIFVYFTGHGFQHDGEFFFCATNFDGKRPNETGLSNSELHTLLRSPEAALVVKVIDACASGSLLIKSETQLFSTSKQGFRNLIQIASCLDSQNSLTGNPLSLFTEKFRTAALRKPEGIVYYTDIIDALRDEFLANDNQVPHFVSQGTGREQFVDNAHKLDGLRAALSALIVNEQSTQVTIPDDLSRNGSLEVLRAAEKRFASREIV